MLTAADLASMRAQQEEAQPETFVISRPTSADDGYGGDTWTYATSSTVTGRVGYLSATEKVIADGMGLERPVVLSMPVGTDCTASDRVTCGSRLFQVAAPLEGSWQTALRVLATDLGNSPVEED